MECPNIFQNFLYNADPNSGGVPVWEQLAQDPAIIAAEQRVGELSDLNDERYRLECELGGHYWNTGVPYVTIISQQPTHLIGFDESRRSFHGDRPMQNDERRSIGIFRTMEGQFVNHKTGKFSKLTAVDEEISIGVAEDKTYFVRDRRLATAHLELNPSPNVFVVDSLDTMLDTAEVLFKAAQLLIEPIREHNFAYNRFMEERNAAKAFRKSFESGTLEQAPSTLPKIL